MNRQGGEMRRGRAAIAIAALYALVLQAFLLGMLPVPGAEAHGFAELCAPLQDASGKPAKHDAKGCCTVACAPLALPLPQQDAAFAAWPSRASVRVVFDVAAPPPARGPPIHAHSPRGPPQA